jgi:16S rRNA (guanine527-N7)-methyltransferase
MDKAVEKNGAKLGSGLKELGLVLGPDAIEKELRFLDELNRWNRKINLTSVHGLDAGIELHLLDSLVLINHLKGGCLLDVGSGAGLPSLPLAIALPAQRIDSVEAVGKKVNFQRHIRRLFGLQNFQVNQCRIEAFEPTAAYAQITARAFASIERIVELVRPLLAEQGELLLLRGSTDETTSAEVQNALQENGLKLKEKIAYRLPFSGAGRHLLKISG